MTCSVWKYELDFVTEQTVKIPYYSQIINVKMNDGYAYLLVLVDLDNYTGKTVDRQVLMYDGNYSIKDKDINYLNTIEDYRGILKHIFIRSN